MSRPIYKEGRISQRERVSLVAELLLDGALIIMGTQKKNFDESHRNPKKHVRVSSNLQACRSQIEINQ